jgi:beta-lactamase regulating signal transducer with metallopeptidase domain
MLSCPLYQLINPERGSVNFRLDTLFDSSRWLNLELWDKLPLSLVFIALLLTTSLIFLFQEMVPIIRHTTESGPSPLDWQRLEDQSEIVRGLEHMPAERAVFYITTSDDQILFTRTGKEPSIYFSTGLIEELTTEELQGALSHEIAHIIRNKRPLLIIVFFFRMMLFFNPVVLLEFRRIVHDEEKICDDMAVESTKNPQALAESLKKLYHKTYPEKTSLEQHGHASHLEDRIKRIENNSAQNNGGQWGKFIFTVIVIAAINYFIV